MTVSFSLHDKLVILCAESLALANPCRLRRRPRCELPLAANVSFGGQRQSGEKGGRATTRVFAVGQPLSASPPIEPFARLRAALNGRFKAHERVQQPLQTRRMIHAKGLRQEGVLCVC